MLHAKYLKSLYVKCCIEEKFVQNIIGFPIQTRRASIGRRRRPICEHSIKCEKMAPRASVDFVQQLRILWICMIFYINFECTWTPTYVVLPTPMSWSKHGTDYWAAFRVINQLWQSCTSLGKDWERKAHNLAKWTVPFQTVCYHISVKVRGEYFICPKKP